MARIRELEDSLNAFQVSNNEEKMLDVDRVGKQLGELKEDVKVLTYSLELAEKREKKLMLELDDWKQKASEEVETSLSGNRSKFNLVEEELAILNKKKNNMLNDFNLQFEQLRAYHLDRIADLKERQEAEIKDIETEKNDTSYFIKSFFFFKISSTKNLLYPGSMSGILI